MIRTTATAVLALAASAHVFAQPAITFEVEKPVLLPGESTTVRLYAGFDRDEHAMGALRTDFVSSVGIEGWSDAALVTPMDTSGTNPGTPSATGYDGIVAGQLYFLGIGIYPDPTNPIAFWQATFTAPVDAAAPFNIDLSTMTSRYDVYISDASTRSESRLAELTEGSGTISVIPGPGSVLVLGLGIVALRRRR